MVDPRHALVMVHSLIATDPRVRRQIAWLNAEGWMIDTVGLGASAGQFVEHHGELGESAAWATTRWGSLLTYLLTPRRRAYRRLLTDRIPPHVVSAVRSRKYALIVANDLEFVPWLTDRTIFGAAGSPHIHLDLHEVFIRYHKSGILWRLLTAGYRRWVRRQLADPVFTTRSTVARGIAELYREKLGIEGMAVIRNSPEFVDQQPTPVDPESIGLVYHGLADWSRGIRDILDAIPLLDQRFDVTFMLTGFDRDIAAIRTAAIPFGDRVQFVPPVAMEDIATSINAYDLEIMVWRPSTENLRYALPNKLFEATQGRLGLVIGRSPMMQQIIERYGNGIVVPDWGPNALAAALNALSADDVATLKAASHAAAGELNADTERAVFLATITAPSPGSPS